MQVRCNFRQQVHLTSSMESKTQRRCARLHSMQFFWILFAGLLPVEIRPARAVEVSTKERVGVIPNSEADITLGEGKI